MLIAEAKYWLLDKISWDDPTANAPLLCDVGANFVYINLITSFFFFNQTIKW